MRTSKNGLGKFLIVFAIFATVFCGSEAGAAVVSSGVSYHGRILKPDGTPLEGANVQFRMQLRTPGAENCLLYEEQRSLNMRASNGVFSLSLNDGTGARLDATGYNLERVLANRGSYSVNATTCESGSGNWTPNEADGRRIQVLFKDETMATWEPLPSQALNFVPMAIETKQIGGFTARHLLRVDDSAVGANSAPLTLTQLNEILSLSNGSSTSYLKASASGVVFPGRATDPTGAVAGQIWFDTASAQLKYNDGSTTKILSSGSALPALASGSIWVGNGSNAATVVAISGDATLAAGGALTLKNTGSANTYYKVTTDAQGRVVSGSTSLAESDLPSLSAPGKVDGGAITSGTIGGTTAINTSGNITSGNLSTNNIYLNANGFQYRVAAPAALSVDRKFLLPNSNGSNGNVLSTDGAGNLSWAPASAGSQWVTATNDIYYNVTGGYVGIGTASPGYPLHVTDATANPTLSIGPTTATSGNAALYLQGKNTGTVGQAKIWADYTGGLNFQPNAGNGHQFYDGAGAPKVSIDSTGRVGIGTTTPSAPLHISSATFNSLIFERTSAANANIQYKNTANSMWAGLSPAGHFGVGAASDLATASFTVQSGGNVGIGTTSPSVSLDVGSRKDAIRLPAGNDSTERPGTPGSGMFRYNTTASALEFYNGTAWQVVGAGGAAGSLTNVSTISNTGGITLTPSSGNSVLINQSTTSTTPTSGALIVNGGAGIVENLNVGGNVVTNGSISATNSTAASAGANGNSPSIYLSANYWNGTSSAVDKFSVTNTMGTGTNPTATLKFDHIAGTPGAVRYAFMNGLVGLGNASPTTRLEVQSIGGGTNQVRLTRSNNTTDDNGITYNPAGTISASNPSYATGVSAGKNFYSIQSYDGTSYDRLVVAADGKVGIGTTSPVATLDIAAAGSSILIRDAGTFTGGALFFGNANHGVIRNYNSVANDVGLYTSSGDVYLSGNGSTATPFVVKNSGRVGIGTSSANSTLSFGSAAEQSIGIERHPSADGANLKISAGGGKNGGSNANGGNLILNAGQSTGSGTSRAQIYVSPGNAGATADNTMAKGLEILGNSYGGANVGLAGANADPTFGLNVNGEIHGNTDIKTAAWNGSIGFSGGTYFRMNNTDGVFAVYKGDGTAYADLFIKNITTTGYVGVGMTPTTNLEVAGEIKASGATNAFVYTDRLNTAARIAMYHNNGNLTVDDYGNGSRMTLNRGTGNMWIAGTLTQASDERLKTEIMHLENSLAKINKIHGVTYRWKDRARGEDLQMGLIAQEVEKEFPAAVRTDDKGWKSVAYQNLVAPIINAIHELFAEQQKMRADLSQLRVENERLKAADENRQREIASLQSRTDKAAKENDELRARLERIEKRLSEAK